MSHKNNNIPDYLDVSSEEEQIIEKSYNYSKNKYPQNNKSDYSYDSYNNKERKHKSNSRYRNHKRSRSRRRSHSRHFRYKERSLSRSRNHQHRNEKKHSYRRNNSYNSNSNISRNIRKNRSRDRYDDSYSNKYYRNHSHSYSSFSRGSMNSNYERDKYRYKSREKSRNKYYNNISHSNSYHNKSKQKNNYNDEYLNDNIIKEDRNIRYKQKEKDEKSYEELKNKWTEGEKKEEFKQIKLEKYDKNKAQKEREKEREREKQKEKEISKLKKNLKIKDKNSESSHSENIIKELPNFEPSGILQKDLLIAYNASMKNEIMINHTPPSDSVVPIEIWFFFKFLKDKKEPEETYKLVGKEFYLIGKDPRVCDIRIKQKNISRQHAVIQFRKVKKNNEWDILPYLIDLNSTNGSYLNGDKIDNQKYYELKDKDELNFGDKKIDFILMKMK